MRSASHPRRQDDLHSRICKTAIEAARAPGALILKSFGKALNVDNVLAHDIKLGLDRASEEIIVGLIKKKFPRHGVLSEELGYMPGDDPFLWIVDPLDGTVNYFHGIPFFCTCVSCHGIEGHGGSRSGALLPDGRVIGATLVGVTYNPLGKELFVGILKGGAFLNGVPLRVEPITDVSQAVILLSPIGSREESVRCMSRLIPRMMERAQVIRNFGSTALDISFVAAGRVGAFVQVGTNLWDFSAAAGILQEAGGIVEAEQYAPGRWRVIASNPGIFAEVRGLVKEFAE